MAEEKTQTKAGRSKADGAGGGKTSGLFAKPSNEARELLDLVVAYARQETLEPLKGLVKIVAKGLAGAFLVGVGLVFLGLAGLRALQDETTAFHDTASWVPYLLVFAGLVVTAGLAWLALGPGRGRAGESR